LIIAAMGGATLALAGCHKNDTDASAMATDTAAAYPEAAPSDIGAAGVGGAGTMESGAAGAMGGAAAGATGPAVGATIGAGAGAGMGTATGSTTTGGGTGGRTSGGATTP